MILDNIISKTWLSQEQVEQYLELIGVELESPSFDFLCKIISKSLSEIPFQNFTMLTRQKIRPSINEICNDMLNGVGGLCTIRNPFLFQILIKLGFHVYYVSCSMEKEDCHIAMIVNLENQKYLVDIGNGFPYQNPIKLGDFSSQKHPFIEYRLIRKNSSWILEHKRNDSWKKNYSFFDKEVDYSYFDLMHENHYQKPGWGPFLTGLRLNKWWDDKFVILRDDIATSPDGTEIIENPVQLETWCNKWFGPEFTKIINPFMSYYIALFEKGLIEKDENKIEKIHDLVGWNTQKMKEWHSHIIEIYDLDSNSKFLDYGCGTLRGGIPIMKVLNSGNYTGVDISELFIYVSKNQVDYYQLSQYKPKLFSLQNFKWEEKYDVILTQSVINHLNIGQLKNVISNLNSVLAQNGIWISTICFDEKITSFAIEEQHPFRENETINSRVNPEFLKQLLSEENLIFNYTKIIHPNPIFSVIEIRRRNGN